ncbi:MAG TPA: dTDP-4-dehydrorhamnose reductase, partial [Candidatus Pacearchaeota archaeon]|nr:dTDP-4-dehydrorhamnose reductase [Candidatus Pacearchaeota archaeon]
FMKFLITGAEGQLGEEFLKEAKKKKLNCLALTREELDITDFEKVQKVVEGARPDFLINCAAYNDVDRAEEDWKTAFLVNGIGPKNLAIAAQENNCVLVHYSTDYVFDGKKNSPYTIVDKPAPINKYGQSKLLGENFVKDFAGKYFLIRLSAVFGNNPKASFPLKILSWAKEKKELKIVDDQVFSPTFTGDVVKGTFDLIKSGEYGLYHMTNSGYCSRYEWAKYILEKIGWQGKILRAKSKDFQSAAERPKFSVLDNFPLKEMEGWKEATERYLTISELR